MKLLVASLTILLSFHLSVRAQGHFVAHEWGTFTTLAGSDGELLPGLYHEEEQLPPFVQHSGDEYNNGLNKGFYDCAGVTIKMETPVIYFYSDIARNAAVHVDWPAGSISQWYPARTGGDYMSPASGDTSRFGDTARNGWIDWRIRVREKSPNDTLGLAKPGETHTWQAPRATDANVIEETSGLVPQVEKYLFYRGIGSAKFMELGFTGYNLLKTWFKRDTLVIDNLTFYNIPFALVYEMTEDSVQTVWWGGAIQGAARTQLREPSLTMSFQTAIDMFRDSLVAQGLYRKEADAMIDTWRQSYFNHPGLRVFWIMPRLATDRSLPLTITPTPDSIERVLVARSEVLTPRFEQALMDTFATRGNLDPYISDRYYLAYQARVAALMNQPQEAVAIKETESVAVYPNPTTSTVTIPGITVSHAVAVDALGREHTITAQNKGEDSVFDLSKLAPGVYLLALESNARTLRELVVKR